MRRRRPPHEDPPSDDTAPGAAHLLNFHRPDQPQFAPDPLPPILAHPKMSADHRPPHDEAARLTGKIHQQPEGFGREAGPLRDVIRHRDKAGTLEVCFYDVIHLEPFRGGRYHRPLLEFAPGTTPTPETWAIAAKLARTYV